MKYSFEEKMKAVEFHEKNHCCDYPESCKNGNQRSVYANNVRQWVCA